MRAFDFPTLLRIGTLVFLAVCVGVLFWVQVGAAVHPDTLIVAFLDVGQGDATYIRTPDGRDILIDAGPDKSVLRSLSKVMPVYDRTIDVVVETHPDLDHIGGIPAVLERFRVHALLETDAVSETGAFKEMRARIRDEGSATVSAVRGMEIALGDSARLSVLFPDRPVAGLEANAGSIILRLNHGENSFLFTGDSPQAIEKYLAQVDSEVLDVDVLQAGHHGSNTSSSIVFLGATTPDSVVISAGKNNRYGHPHQDVLERFGEFGIEVLRTDDLGTIVFESDGETLRLR